MASSRLRVSLFLNASTFVTSSQFVDSFASAGATWTPTGEFFLAMKYSKLISEQQRP